MLALEKRHKIENSQNRAIALTLFGICLTQKTKKKVSKVTRNKQHKQHKRRRKGEKKIETFYRHDYQLNRLKSHSQSTVCVLNKNETQHKMYAHLI